MDCILDLTDVQFASRDNQIFFASSDLIVYKDASTIIMTNCAGEEITFCPCPRDYRNFEVLDLGDAILLVLAGKHIVVLDKEGAAPVTYEINIDKIGRIITKPYQYEEDSVLFGTKRGENIQIVNFDFLGNKRMSQSASWKVNKINDIVLQDNMVYALLDSSFLVGCDAESCEVLWKRFEAGFVNKHLVPHDGGILYSCQGLIRQYKDGEVETIQVPLAKISSLIACIDDRIVFASEEDTNIGSYSLEKNRLIWEIVGSDKILESIILKGKVNDEVFNALAIRVNDKFGLVNIDLGRSAHFGRCHGVYRIRKTADHLILNKSKGQTDMIPGIQDVG